MPSPDTRARAQRRALGCAAAVAIWIAAVACDGHGGANSARDAGTWRDGGGGSGRATLDAALDASSQTRRDAAARDAAPTRDAAPDAADDPADADAGVGAADADAARARRALVAQDAWRPVAATDDTFEDRPDDATCEPTGHGYEPFADELAYSVDTGKCSYLTATQVTLDDVQRGEEVRVRVWHFDLSGPAGAEAHVALSLDGITLVDERIAIPATSGLLFARWPAPKAIPAGAPVLLHIHNHGANSYAFLELSTGAPD